MVPAPDNLGTFSNTVQQLYELADPCVLCPRKCRARRRHGENGYCRVTDTAKVSSVTPHFGEESVLVGAGGSGTIFFSGCNLGCIYCQNYEISHYGYGSEMSLHQLTKSMLDLQKSGCSNINLVTPTHQIPVIAAAIESARKEGLNLPVVYNSGGYDSPGTIDLLAEFVDIYMPDVKYADSEIASQLSNAPDYPRVVKSVLKKMYSQKGDLRIESGLATKGVLVRHLVLPGGLAGSFEILDFLAEEISPSTAINIMGQYRPCYKAYQDARLSHRPSVQQIEQVKRYALDKGLRIID